jgi:hypothetical protein
LDGVIFRNYVAVYYESRLRKKCSLFLRFRESEKDGLTFGGIDLYSPMVGPLLDAVKLFLDDARGFLAASLGAPDGRVVREHSRLGPLDV